jgi:hypothetical protein
MDNDAALAILTDANARMMKLSDQMEALRAQQLEILKAAQALANETAVKQAARTVGLYPQSSNNRFVRVPEGVFVISSVRLGKAKHTRELAFPLCEAGDWASSRPASESWLIASAPLINAKELFNEPKTTYFLGL